MDDSRNAPGSDAPSRWTAPQTAKERTAVQHAVARLFDALAPERAAAHMERPTGALQRHRSPRGIILQGPTSAVSVSWFPDASTTASFGELQVVAWRGVVSRPGSTHRAEGAAATRELIFRPADRAPDAWDWRGQDGTTYDSDSLVSLCFALLEDQQSATNAGGTTTTG
jgi:hypothetical protein